jgi:hypothetical protein
MSLAEAFEGLKKSAPERLSPQAPREREPVSAPVLKHSSTQVPERLSPQAPGLPLQGTAKSKHPDFEAKKVFVRKDTAKAAGRKWEDAGGGDFSDLVETLLSQYLGT